MRTLCLSLSLLASCSGHLPFVASRTMDFTMPVAGVQSLQCTSHNGTIAVTGAADCAEIAVQVRLSVRGKTQEEADDHLTKLEVERRVDAGTLVLAGKAPPEIARTCSPSYSFAVTMPRECGLTLRSHNGDIEARGTRGAVQVETHNGDVTADVDAGRVDVVTHNGHVEMNNRSVEDVSGRIETHNGGVRVTFAAGASSSVAARTHNGSVEVTGTASANRIRKNAVDATYGDGRGKLAVTTHNGSVELVGGN